MEKQEEFEIVSVEKYLGEKKRKAIVGSTIYAVSSAVFFASGILFAKENLIIPTVLEGIETISTGIAAKDYINEVKNISKKIKSLRK